MSKHRKNMALFRDKYLLQIFQSTIDFLEKHASNSASVSNQSVSLSYFTAYC